MLMQGEKEGLQSLPNPGRGFESGPARGGKAQLADQKRAAKRLL